MRMNLCPTGIWAGMRTVRYFDGKTYEWVGISRQPNIISKVCRFAVFTCKVLFHFL